MPRLLAVLCLVLLFYLAEAHFLEPATSPPKPKKAAGANENSPVYRRDGLVLAANSSADGNGCIAFWDRMPTGKLLLQTEGQETIGNCSRTCRETAPCNAFVWCPRKAGCHTGSSFSNIARLPYQGCALLYQGLSEASTGRPTLAVKAPGFAGGAPITVGDLPELPGYKLRLGRGFFNRYDYICEGSAAANSCMLWGRAHELAARCDADPLCRIMIDLPFGWDYLGGAMTSFKGGLDCDITAEGAEFEGILNPNAATYMKLGPLPARPEFGSSSVADYTVAIMVGAVGVLATIAAMGWSKQRKKAPAAAAEYSQQQQEQQQQCQGLASGKDRPQIHDSAREEMLDPILVGQARSVAYNGAPSSRTTAWVAAAAVGGEQAVELPRMSRMHSSGPAGHPVNMWMGMGSGSVPSRVSSVDEGSYLRSADLGRASTGCGAPDSGSMGSAFAAPSLQGLRQPQGYVPPPAINLAPATSTLPSPFGGFQAQSHFDEEEQEELDTPQSVTTATCTATDLQHSARSSGGAGGYGSGQHSGQQNMRNPVLSGGGTSSACLPPSSRPPPGPSRLPPMRVLPGGGGSGGQVFSGGSGEGSAGSMGGQQLSHRSAGSDPLGSPSAAKLLSRLPEQHWEDWVVGFETIEFCMNADGSYVSLGSGGFGTVYKIMLDGVQPYAAKVLDLGQEDELQSVFLREASVLQRLRHRNIVGFRGVSVSEGRGIIIMELMEGADLFSRLTVCNKATGERQFSWYNRGKRVALDVARGVHYLHSLHLTHFDIKASNVLISRAGTAKLADVGFTRAMANTHHSIKDNRVGTFSYMAPELLMGTKCTSSVDIFSFGVLLWEICSGEHPVRGQLRGLRVPEEAPQQVVDLCEDCMSVEPAARPSARQVVERLLKVMAPPAAASTPASGSGQEQQSR